MVSILKLPGDSNLQPEYKTLALESLSSLLKITHIHRDFSKLATEKLLLLNSL